MPENLLCKHQKGTTPAFREGWDRVFDKWTAEEIQEAREKARETIIILRQDKIYPGIKVVNKRPSSTQVTKSDSMVR